MQELNREVLLWPEARYMRGFFERFRGLNGEPEPTHRQAYWFPRCRSIHTYGMRAPIDVVAVDKQQVIRSVHRHLVPGRGLYLKGCYGVIELAAFCPWPLEQWLGKPLLFIQQGERVNVLKESRFSIAIQLNAD